MFVLTKNYKKEVASLSKLNSQIKKIFIHKYVNNIFFYVYKYAYN